jgi:predicted porin
MKRFAFTIFVVLFLSSISQAGMFIEPYAGYNFGTFQQTMTTLGTNFSSGSNSNGFGAGALLGYSLGDILYVAADYQYNTLTLGSTTGALILTQTTGTQNMIGLDVGANLLFLKFFAGYIISDQVNQSLTPSVTWSGNGFKIGAGVKLIPMLWLNVAYETTKCTTASPSSVSGVTATELDINSVFAFLSVPISF